jgi:hypothetical protein
MEHSVQNKFLGSYSMQKRKVDNGIDAFLTQPTIGRSSYHLEISLKYKAPQGCTICVMGEIPELGMWNDKKCWMKQTHGDFWVTEKPIVTN